MDAIAVVVDADRFLPLGLVVGQVVHGEQAVHLLAGLHDSLGDFASIEGVRALLSDQPQGAGEVGPQEACSRRVRRSRAVEDGLRRLGEATQVSGGLVHDLAVDVGDGKPVLGVAYGLPEQALAVHGAVGLVEGEPACEVAGDQRGEDALFERFLGEAVGRGGLRHPPREVERSHPSFGGDVGEGEADASDARHVGLDDVQGRRDGDHGVEGVAALGHDLDAGERRQRVGG